jgi:lipopolysaccharide exporter
MGAWVLVLLFSPFVAVYYGQPELTLLLNISGLVFIFNGLSQVPRGLLQRDLHFRPLATTDVVGVSVGLIVAVALSPLLGVISYAISLVVAAVVRTGLLLWETRKMHVLGFQFRFRETTSFLSFGIYQTLDALVSFVINSASTAMLGKLVSPAAMGGYSLAYNYAVNTVGKLNPVITSVMFPTLSAIQDDKERLTRGVLKMLSLVTFINVPILGMLAIAARPFTLVLLGKEWLWIIPMLQILSLYGITRAVGNPMGAVLMATNHVRLGFWINVIKAGVTVVVVYGAILAFGIEGSAWAMFGLGLASIILNAVLLKVLLGMSFTSFSMSILMPVLLALPVLIVTGILTEVTDSLPAVWQLAFIFASATIIIGATVLTSRNPILVDMKSFALTMIGKLRR